MLGELSVMPLSLSATGAEETIGPLGSFSQAQMNPCLPTLEAEQGGLGLPAQWVPTSRHLPKEPIGGPLAFKLDLIGTCSFSDRLVSAV